MNSISKDQIQDVFMNIDLLPVQESKVSRAWRLRDDLIYVECKPGAKITLEDAIMDMKISQEMMKGSSYWGLVVEMANIDSISKEARIYYSREQNSNQKIKGVGLIANSVFTRVIANFFIGFERSVSPIRVFNSKESAFDWILNILENQKV